jgi:hypothetical protein
MSVLENATVEDIRRTLTDAGLIRGLESDVKTSRMKKILGLGVGDKLPVKSNYSD